jgi:hypothetical protein
VFNVAARDARGNDLLLGDYQFAASVTSGPDESLTFNARDLNNGTTRFTFTPTTIGDYMVAITAGPSATPVGVVAISVVPSSAGATFDATQSFASGAGLRQATVGTPATFLMHTLDSQGVPLTTGGQKFTATISGNDIANNRRASQTVKAMDQKDDTYLVTYVLTTAPDNYVLDVRHSNGTRSVCFFHFISISQVYLTV